MRIQKKSKIHFLPSQAILYAALAFATTACSLRNYNAGTTTVSIAIPGSQKDQNSSRLENPADFGPISRSLRKSPKAAGGGGGQSNSANTVPAALTDFNCYAVNISGPGIAPAVGTNCGTKATGQYIGIYGGMYSSGPQTVSFQVPNGPGISIQLIGFDQSACTPLASIFNGSSNNNNGASPYLLASSTIDLTQDTDVDLTATYDPANPQQALQNCVVGAEANAIAPTRAFQGLIPVTAAPSPLAPALTLVGETPPAGFATASNLTGSTALSISSLPTVCQNCGQQPALVSGMVSSSISTPDSRAVVQLVWDLTANKIPLTGYANFELSFRGGQADFCATGQAYGATAGVWDKAENKWISIGSGTYSNENNGSDTLIQWFSGSSPINAPLSSLAVPGSDGDLYLVVQVESNYAGTAAVCPSAVYISAAGLATASSPAGEIDDNNTLRMTSNAIQGTSSNSIVGGYGQSILFSTQGGVPPYSYSCSLTGCSVDQNGVYTAPAAGSSDTVVVADSLGASTWTIVTLAGTGVAEGISLVLDSYSYSSLVGPASDGSYSIVAGSCVDLDANAVSYAGMVNFTTVDFTNVTLNANGTSIPVYAAPGCTTASGTLNLTSSQLTGLFVQPTQAGAFRINASSNSSMNANSGVTLTISPAAYYGVAMVAPPLMTEGECVPVTIQQADQYGNANPTGAPAVVTVSDISSIGNYAELYSNSSCTSPAISLSVPADQALQYYFKDTGSAAAWDISSNITPGFAQGSTTSSGVFFAAPTSGTIAYQTEPAGQAVKLGIYPTAELDSHNCLEVMVGSTDSAGTWTPPQGSDVDINLQIPSGSSWFVSQTACDSNTSGNASTVPVAITASPWYQEIWLSNISESEIIGASQGTGPNPPLMPSTFVVP
jgi:hypothetical protein